MAELELKNISKQYNNNSYVIKDLNLKIDDGEFIVFVGPSGCGKSTILRMLAGLEEISGGDFLIDGKKVNSHVPQKRRVAMVFQSYALYPHLTVYDNIAFPLSIKKLDKTKIDEKVHAVSKVLDLSTYLKRKPKELSGGQRQRVALGRAMVRKPKVFLLDEPLSNLDAKLRVEMRIEISQLHEHLKTNFIYVTHDQVEAMTLGQRIMVLKDGYMQQFAAPVELYNYPANMFVAGFIGSPAMNFFEAELIQNDGNYFIKTDFFNLKLANRYLPYIKNYTKKKVIFGIRPVDIYIQNTRYEQIKEETNIIKGNFVLREILGDEVLYYIASNSLILETNDDEKEDEKKTFVIKSNTVVDYKKGLEFECYADPEKYYLFDIDTKKSITEIKGKY